MRTARVAVQRLTGRVVLAVLLTALFVALVVAPTDARQGDVQRLMYIHVPAAWLAYVAFLVTFVASAAYLARGSLITDAIGAASAEVGLLFTGLAIATGAMWGRATWGVWWDWDPRLTTTAVLFLVFASYVLVRAGIVDRTRRARASAVLGIVGFANVPVVHFSVLWWRSLHQPPTVIRPGDPTIDHAMLAVLALSVLSFTVLYIYLARARFNLELVRAGTQDRLVGLA